MIGVSAAAEVATRLAVSSDDLEQEESAHRVAINQGLEKASMIHYFEYVFVEVNGTILADIIGLIKSSRQHTVSAALCNNYESAVCHLLSKLNGSSTQGVNSNFKSTLRLH